MLVLCGQVLPLSLAWILAILARLLLTGALHEDGLADFIDGFGWQLAVPPVVAGLLILLMKRKNQSYTGDCCGATFLLCGLLFYLTLIAV